MRIDMGKITESIEALRKAMLASDHAALGELTDEALSYGHTSGLVETKEEFVDAIGSRDEFKTITISELSVTETDSFAIVRHRFQAEVYVHGELANPDIRVLQVWSRESGEWKLIARQAFRA